MHGADSVRLAVSFAEIYNRRMKSLVANSYGYRCTRYID